ncbi:uncharacterized protein LOC105176629 [Sesamum indicum]|uniref:Uncharacterized protein LOC105176629 n=1 Tax=Sesamum indicum TaxID=4182 RepID=A0A6I9U9X4_SESIN|nr:uncharacterized protein LOC105176629 [Sesamum indicum]
MNKNYLFLICNGLLVFLAKTSGSDVGSLPDFGLDDMSQKSSGDGSQMASDSEATVLETDMAADETKESEQYEEENDEAGDQSAYCSAAAEVSVLVTDDSEQDEQIDGSEATDCGLLHSDKDLYDNDHEEEIEKLSMEELNQKFEDFIRKMKEEMRITEARQQLVLVN